jgi:hypothetical protein
MVIPGIVLEGLAILEVVKFYFMRPVILVFLLSFSLVSAAVAQPKVVRYCTVSFIEKGLSPKMTVTFSAGKEDSLFSKNTRFIYDLKHVEYFSTVPDALNYMTSIGWTPMNFPQWPDRGSLTLYFKKELDPSEIKGN